MKTYKCHKIVKAEPMNLGDYNTLRGWQIPDDEDASTEGYLVVYPDSNKTNNVEGYDGYVSWSPKDVFDVGYTEVE